MFRARFSIPLALLSTLLTACGGSSRPELRVNENNLCSKFQVQAKAWTPALVKNGLGCLLYDHNQPDSPRYQKLVALPDSAFAQTAVWLNQMLSQEKRGAFFGQLEDFPTEASQLIAIEANRSFAMLPDFARALPFWMATLKLAAINDAQPFRALAL
ncbi:MAG: hypothetical protein JST16_13625, partial [Bdellovibrionales bacterium]|nr:hypothetical protein [Bdellovibrionales bacterium]